MKTVKLITQEFTCTPEAAQKLESYIAELKNYFNNHEDYDEDVIEDILIACEQKLLSYTVERADKTILEEDVAKIIRQLWTTELMEASVGKEVTTISAKFFRDKKRWWIGWVCAWLAAYLSLPVWVVRIAFLIIMFTPLSILPYLLLWYIIPAAKTKSDELRMYGKPVSISTLTQDATNYTKKKVISLAKAIGIVIWLLITGIIALFTLILVGWYFAGESTTTYTYECNEDEVVYFTEVYEDPTKIRFDSSVIGGKYRYAPWIKQWERISNELDVEITRSLDKWTLEVKKWDKIIHEWCIAWHAFDSDWNQFEAWFIESIRHFFDVDACLDKWWAWDYDAMKCSDKQVSWNKNGIEGDEAISIDISIGSSE